MRTSSPIELSLQPVPNALARARAYCPYCWLTGERAAAAIGRIGLRLVFRCTSCRTRFFRGHLRLTLAGPGGDLEDTPLALEPDVDEEMR